MGALYWRAPTADQMAGTGLKSRHFKTPRIDLWPENDRPLMLFMRLHTQWRTGPGGPIGLDYGVIFHELDREGLAGEDYDDMMQSIRVIERAALAEMRKE